MTHRGRFAPSPTGPLHFGSVVTAVASYLDARAHGGLWFVRIDDLDQPRVAPGAESSILRELERLGLGWDGEVMRQHAPERLDAYQFALARLAEAGKSFPCGCTRRDLAGGPYPGTCRLAIPPGKTSRTIRLHVPGPHVEVRDRVLGENRILTADFGNDFVIQRADDVAAYHLACVVDDAALGITHIVRGADLLTSTAAQQSLIQGLGLPEILYAHIPIVVDAARIKLSKRAHATPTNQFAGATVLSEALHALGMAPAPALQTDIDELLAWAIGAWDMAGVATDTILAPPHFGGAG